MKKSTRRHTLTPAISFQDIDQQPQEIVDCASPGVCLFGELSEISPVDLLQLFNNSRKTGKFDIILEHGLASVVFKEGEIVYARYINLRDEEAVHELVGVKSGQFIYTKGLPKELENAQPIGAFMHMLMKGLQRLDDRDA